MTTKQGKKVSYLDGLLPIKSTDPFIPWSCEIISYLYNHSAYARQIWEDGDLF